MQINRNNIMAVGTIGVLIPALFITGFLVFFFYLNPNALSNINGIIITLFNINGMQGQNWVALFNYLFIGFLIVIFCIGMLFTTKNYIVDLLAKVFLLISGISWMGLGINKLNPSTIEKDYFVTINMISTLATLFFGILGFFMFAFGDEFNRIGKGKVFKWLLSLIAVYIFIESILFISINNYPLIITYTSWILYFFGFGILGMGIMIGNQKIADENLIDFDNF